MENLLWGILIAVIGSSWVIGKKVEQIADDVEEIKSHLIPENFDDQI